jgi:hypothetical protein
MTTTSGNEGLVTNGLLDRGWEMFFVVGVSLLAEGYVTLGRR